MSEEPARADGPEGLVWTDLPACPICGCARRRPFDRFALSTENRFVQCVGCSVVYLSPRPVYDEKYLARTYTGGGGSIDPGAARARRERGRTKVINRSIDLMEQVERFMPAKGTLLDVGCSVGHLLEIARGRGWRVTGLDLSERRLDVCRRKGLEVYREDITATRPERRYDVVTARHVLEHTVSPVDFLSAIRDRAADGGLVVIEVPNIDAPNERQKRWRARHGLGRPRVTGIAHLFEFTRKAFLCAADRAGLVTIATHTYGHDYRRGWLNMVRRKILMRFMLGSKLRFFLRRPRGLPVARGLATVPRTLSRAGPPGRATP